MFQERVRMESRTGLGFGRDRELENPFFRTRIGAHIQAAPWMEFGVMGQDARSPGYGGPAPGNARDPFDLQEAYVELFGNRKTGWGASAGRRIIGYGEQRLLGAPDWAHTGRTFDSAQLYYRWAGVRVEALLMSSVQVRPEAFNRPVLSDRVWGTYNRFGPVDAYLLRHDIPDGGTNTLGGRVAGPIGAGLRLSIEGVAQNGSMGTLDHRAFAWHSTLSRAFQLRWPVELSVEYNYASGSDDPARRSGTFDQLYPANHEKYGQADLFGWRNLQHARTFDSIKFQKLTLRLMYSSYWLASPRDALYNLQGRPIVRSPLGTAGRHVGHEVDIFATYPWRGFLWGAGFAHFFAGEFIRNTTPGVNPRYVYFFQTYGF
jgi:hypothetical protein